VNALKQRDMERTQKAEIATLSASREARKNKTGQARRKDGEDDAEYCAGKH
jgi:hypothetical protein